MAVSGKEASVAVNGVNYAFSKWEVAFGGPFPDVTNFGSSGCRENVDSIAQADVTLEGPHNPGSMPLVRGTVYTFLLRVNSGVTFSVPARVRDLNPSVDVKGAAMLRVVAESTGSFTPAVT